MSDASEDPAGPNDAGAKPASEPALGAWAEPVAEPAWTEIQLDAEAAGPGRPGPDSGAGPQAPSDTGSEGGRQRRPSSLRSSVEASGSVQRRKLTPPPFPKPGPASVPDPTPQAAGSTPAAKSGPSAIEKFVSLVNERPEVGVGLAFAGGLVLATILKRLAR